MVTLSRGRILLKNLVSSFKCLRDWDIVYRLKRKNCDTQYLGVCEYDETLKRVRIYLRPKVWKLDEEGLKRYLFHEVMHSVLASFKQNIDGKEERMIDDLCFVMYGRRPTLK
jgi:hypothetical protein